MSSAITASLLSPNKVVPYGDPLVSVVVPTFNRDRTIARAIFSALRQTYKNLEVIVVDDGSRDSSVPIVKSIAASHPQVRLIEHRTNRGGSAARNTAIAAAKGEVIAFLDSDDEWRPEKLWNQLAATRLSDTHGFACYSGFVFRNKTTGVSRTRIGRNYGERIRLELAAGNVVGTTSTVLVERRALLACGGFDETLPSCQDWDMWLRLSRTVPFYCVPTPLVSFCVESSNRISNNRDALFAGHLVVFAKALQCHWNDGERSFIRAGHHRALAYLHLRFGEFGLAIRNALKSIAENRSPSNLRRLAHFAQELIRASAERRRMY